VTVVVSNSSISDLAMHFLERYRIMVIKVPSKFDIRRLCRATGATALARLV
jgi:T-complex protein 1 subunit theta